MKRVIKASNRLEPRDAFSCPECGNVAEYYNGMLICNNCGAITQVKDKMYAKCSNYALKIQQQLLDAKSYIATGNDNRAIYCLERASDYCKILNSFKNKCSDHKAYFAELCETYQSDIGALMSAITDSEEGELSGSDQYAIEIAIGLMSQGKSIEDAAYEACNIVNEGNAEPEYADEEFYEDEADYNTVLKYLKAR